MNTNLFFGYVIDPELLGSRAILLLLAVLLGGLIGFEREWHGNPAGMRTHILVCVGSAVITLTSVEIGLGVRGGMRGDPGHIAAQIVSGVGFLGAGAILREGATVRGLTSAASIWATAGIGIALGASPHLAELAVFATGVVLTTLAFLEPLERQLRLKRSDQALAVEVAEANNGPERVLDLLTSMDILVVGVVSDASPASINPEQVGPTEAVRQMAIRVKLPRRFDRQQFNKRFLSEPGVRSFHMP